MKIKILTFHRENNYGANLQAYALRQHLLSEGHEVDFIDFDRSSENYYLSRIFKPWVGRSISATAHKWRARLRKYPSSCTTTDKFKDFQREFLPAGARRYKTLGDLQSQPPDADCYIVGSDQVWSEKLVSDAALPAYFLTFGNSSIRKVAYAASSGGEDFKKRFRQPIANYLSSFYRIGVREESLCETLAAIGINNCEWTPDPTVLLHWNTYIRTDDVRRESTTGIFLLNRANYAKVLTGSSPFLSQNTSSDYRFVNLSSLCYTPPEWVRSIAARQLLITDSYHAVLFAIYTHTPFVFIRWGNNHKRDGRVLFLLNRLGLTEFARDTITVNNTTVDNIPLVNWDSVSNRIKDMRDTGIAFLRKALT